LKKFKYFLIEIISDNTQTNYHQENLNHFQSHKNNTSLHNKSFESKNLKHQKSNEQSAIFDQSHIVNASIPHMFDSRSVENLLKNFSYDNISIENTNYILRELRCRLSHKSLYKIKHLTLNSIIMNDFLGLKNPCSNVLINLLNNEKYYLS
jgi:hypothetical protein